jgi:hypothetical protein
VDFATAPSTVAEYFYFDPPYGVGFWSTLGCFAVALNDGALCDLDGSRSKLGTKSFRNFCPQTCGVLLSGVRQNLKAAQIAYPTECDAAAVESPSLDVGSFCKLATDGKTIMCDRANVSAALKLGAKDDDHDSDCTDLSDAQLATANELITGWKEDGALYGIPQSCRAASADSPMFLSHSNSSLTCDDLFRLWFWLKSSIEGELRFNLARHPCPVACHACPPVTFAESLTDSSEAT